MWFQNTELFDLAIIYYLILFLSNCTLQASISLLYTFCEKTDADYSQFIPTLFRAIIHLMNDSDELVVDMSWNALNAVTKVYFGLTFCEERNYCSRVFLEKV